MPGISPIHASNKLNVSPSAKPVRQKVRRFHSNRHSIIQAEVDNLLHNGFIIAVKYPEWLANVVVVPKKGNKWRVCVDYTDLNDACPKNSFPLPRIDQIVDASIWHGMLSFLDAFSGYHQIPMHASPPPPPPHPPRCRKYIFHYAPWIVLLQCDALQIKECRGYLSEAGDENVLTLARWHYGSLY